MRKIYLQMFMNMNTNVTTDAGLKAEIKTYYDNYLIDNAEPELVHDQFAMKKPIPQGGGKSIEFRKYASLPKATTPLTEGVTPDGSKLTVSTITATVAQYGNYITLSDMVKMTAIDDNVVESVEILGSQAGRTLDTITRDVLAGGTNVIYAGGKTSRANLTATDTLTVDLIFKAAAVLKDNNAPKNQDSYVAIIHPNISYDLMTSDDWKSIHQYDDPEPIFMGEIGKIGNVRFVESTEAKIWNDSTCPSGLAVYSTLVVGAKAYATTEISGGGLETILKPLGAGEDPLNQRATCGWKATKVSERLVEEYMVRIETVSAGFPAQAAN